MPTGSHQKAVWAGLALTVAAALALGLAAGSVALRGNDFPIAVQLGALALIMLLGYPASLPWWRKLDEMAREAHLVSWFWGAQIGGGVAFITAVVLAVRGKASDELFYGAGMVFIGQLVAYLLVWGGWWLLRRGGRA